MNLTCPTEIASPNLSRNRIHVFFSEERQEINTSTRKKSSLLRMKSSKAILHSKIHSDLLNSQKQDRKVAVSHFVKIYFLPNFLGGLVAFLISYTDYYGSCDPDDLWVSSYRYMYEILFDLAFYTFFCYNMLFPYIFEDIRRKKSVGPFNWIIIGIYGLIHIFFQVIVKIKLLDDFMYMHIFNLAISHFLIWILCRYGNIKFAKIKQNYIIFVICAGFLIFNHYVMKAKVVVLLKDIYLKEHKTLLKLFLFTYFNTFRFFLNRIMTSHFKFCLRKKCEKNDYGIIIFFKFIISDLISSVLIPVFSYNEDNFNFLVNVFLFGYQIAIIYLKSNILIEYIKKIVFYVLNIQNQKSKIDRIGVKSLNQMIISTNEVSIIMYIKILMLMHTRKFLIYSKFTFQLADKCSHFNSNLQLTWEALIILIMLNSIIVVSIACFKDKEKDQMKRNLIENRSLLKDVFHTISIYFYVERNYQFFFFLSFVGN